MIKKKNINQIIFLAFCFIVIISFVSIIISHIRINDKVFIFDDENLSEWNDSWEINYDGKIKNDISLPVEVPVTKGHSVILRKKLPDKIKEYNCIMIEGKRQDIDVSIGGIQRASYTDKDNRPWGKTTPSGVVLVPLYNTDSREDVAINISSDSVFSGKIGKIYLGNEKSLVMMLIKSNIVWLFLVAIVFIVGLTCGVCYITYRQNFEISKAMLFLSEFAVLSSVWSLSQLSIRQIFFADLTTLEAVGYCCYMLIPIPLALYIRSITDTRYSRYIKLYIYIASINFTIENILQNFVKISFFETIHISQIIFVGGIIGILEICFIEARRDFDLKIKMLTVGTIGLLIGEVIEIIFQSLRFAGEEYNRYIVGAFVFISMEFIYTMICVSREQKQRKEAESRNLAKTLFLSSMSHEIKTPINAVIGMNEMIMRDTNEDNIREYAANVRAAGKSLLSLVNDILDFSKIESGDMDIVCEIYEMKSVLSDLVHMTESRIGNKNIKLVTNIDSSIPSEYFGDKVRIKQVITNLLTNAVKYTEKGEITFTVENRGIQGNEIQLYFSIKDTGTGIKDEDISRFMDSFVRIEQVKNSNIEGTGIGLSITVKLLNLMDSKLEVDSVYGEGSDFHFMLKQKITDFNPMGAIELKNEETEKPVRIDFTSPEIKVLAVDDNKVNLTVLAGILRPTRMKIALCDSGEKCLELCKNNYFDLIFMDHMMPEMDGVETFKRLREQKELKSSKSPVVVFTANTVSGAADFYKETGFDYYLKKPVDVGELNSLLHKFISADKMIPLTNE